jgi:prepilin signal peptidase PulO-like enzyme (type II secretory pathway)
MTGIQAEAVGAIGTDSAPARDQAATHVAPPDWRGLIGHPGAVIAIGAALAIIAFTSYGHVAQGLIAALMVMVLVVLGVIDFRHRIIPNRIVIPAGILVLVANIAFSPDRAAEFAIAASAATVLFLVPNLISPKLMGMGDVKLAFLLGAGLGWAVAGALLVAYLAVFPAAVAMIIRGGAAARKATLPFGPFLAAGALVMLILPGFLGLQGV